jgi:hypothetical protein
MAEDRDSMASGLLESLGEEELLSVVVGGLQAVPEGERWSADGVVSATLVGSLVRTILARSFPALRGNSELDALERDVTEAIMAHESSMHRLNRLGATLRSRAAKSRRGRS